MPKTVPNYANSYIYKLCCRDVTIEHIYIGSTTNMTKRRCQHKSHCNNPNNSRYKTLVYRCIRNNGNWDNWDMVMIEKCNVKSKQELHARERYYIELLKSTLNTIIPTRTEAEYYIDNKEHCKQHKAQYRKDNKEYYKQYRVQYYKDNKEQIQQSKEQYYKDNKEHIKQYRSTKHMCDCGIPYTQTSRARHKKSNRHIEYMSNPFINMNL